MSSLFEYNPDCTGADVVVEGDALARRRYGVPMELTSPVGLALIALTLWLTIYWRPRRHIWAAAAKIPGPRGWPLIGNSLLFWGSLSENFSNMRGLCVDFGRVVRIWAGPKLYVLLYSAGDAQRVLGNPRVRNRDENMSAAMRSFFGNGLLSNRDDTWRVHRKFITSAFHFKILETYVQIFAAKAAILTGNLDKMADGRSFDIYTSLGQCTLDAICETAIGTTMNTQTEGESEFMRVLYEVVQHVHKRSMQPWLLNPLVCRLSGEGRRAQPVIEALRAFSAEVIHRKLAEHRAGGGRSSEVVTGSSKTVASFLDMLIAEGGGTLSETEIQAEVTTMAAAGLETTATVMSFALVLLALHPEEQRKVQHELDGVYGDGPGLATPELLARMPVLERAIKETLRLFPVVTMLPRELPEDLVLESGYLLPKGATAIVFVYTLHRDPASFPKPNEFIPDRWLESRDERHPYAYLPFSGGARNCVGQKYAMLQMKSVLSAVLHRFDVSTPFTMATLDRLEMSITICIDQSLRHQVQLKLRDKFRDARGSDRPDC